MWFLRAGLLCLTLAALAGCQHGSAVTPLDAAQSDAELTTPIAALQTGESLAGMVTIQIDPAGDHAEVLGVSPRIATSQPPQNLAYDLDLDKFLSPTNFRVSNVANIQGQSIDLTLQFTHPFRAPIMTGQPTAGNRADLGFTGRLLVLADQNHETATIPGDGTFTWDNKYLIDPDGFAEVGDLLRTQGLTNNLFPYVLLVDEALDNRVGVSNAGDMTGNYDAPGGGWQRANAGDPANQWTGYDYVHQGQVVERTLHLNWADVRASGFQFRVALLAKYTDPRGTADYTFRLPFAPVDVTKFAYRLPQAALDVSGCEWCNVVDLNGPQSVNHLELRLRDWDAQGAVAGSDDLSAEADVSKVRPGTSGYPAVELASPLLPAGISLARVGGTGLPGDELRYEADDMAITPIEGIDWGFYIATDPETIAPSFATTHFGVDPNTLAASPARALKPRTFMPVRIQALASHNWVRTLEAPYHGYFSHIATTPQGTILAAVAYAGAVHDLDPAPCIQTAPVGEGSDVAVLELDGNGHLLRRVTWAGQASEFPGVAQRDAAGNIYVAFAATNSDQSNNATSVDLDPGAGIDTHAIEGGAEIMLVKLDPDGNYLWGRDFGGGRYQGFGWVYGMSVVNLSLTSTGQICLVGAYYGTIDIDPGPGAESATTSTYGDYFLSVFDDAGNWQWAVPGINTFGGTWADPVELPSGNLATVGTFDRAAMDFAPGPPTLFLDNGGGTSAFLIEYTPAGAVVQSATWHKPTPGDVGATQARVIERAPDGSLVILGTYAGTIDFDPGVGDQIHTGGDGAAFWSYVLHLTASGAYDWVSTLDYEAPTARQYGLASMVLDELGGAVVAGTVTDATIDLDPGTGQVLVTDDASRTTNFWLRLDSTGALDWSRVPVSGDWENAQMIRASDDGLLFRFYSEKTKPMFFDDTHSYQARNGSFGLVHLDADGTWE